MICIIIYIAVLVALIGFSGSLFHCRPDLIKKESRQILICCFLWPFTLFIPALMIAFSLIFNADSDIDRPLGFANDKPFYLTFDKHHFRKGDILNTGNGQRIKILVVYKDNWLKKQLRKLGFNIRFNQVKVKSI